MVHLQAREPKRRKKEEGQNLKKAGQEKENQEAEQEINQREENQEADLETSREENREVNQKEDNQRRSLWKKDFVKLWINGSNNFILSYYKWNKPSFYLYSYF